MLKYASNKKITKFLIILLIFLIFISIILQSIYQNKTYEDFTLDDVYSIKQQLDSQKIINNITYNYDDTSQNFYTLSNNEINQLQSSSIVAGNYSKNNSDIINILTQLLYIKCPLDDDRKDHILSKLELQHNTIKNDMDYFDFIAISIKLYLDLFNNTFLTSDILDTLIILLNNMDITKIEMDNPKGAEKYEQILKKINSHWFFGDGLCNKLEFYKDTVRLNYDAEKSEIDIGKDLYNQLTHDYFVEINKVL